jgi:hypothetical protein
VPRRRGARPLTGRCQRNVFGLGQWWLGAARRCKGRADRSAQRRRGEQPAAVLHDASLLAGIQRKAGKLRPGSRNGRPSLLRRPGRLCNRRQRRARHLRPCHAPARELWPARGVLDQPLAVGQRSTSKRPGAVS